MDRALRRAMPRQVAASPRKVNIEPYQWDELALVPLQDMDFAYGIGEAAGEALGEGELEASSFFDFFLLGLVSAFSASVMGPTLTVLASRLPSAAFT